MGPSVSSDIRLSPSALNLFLECPVCFWLEKARGLKRPRGIFPSLPGGMDRVIKAYFDGWRKRGTLPPELQVEAFRDIALFSDQAKLDQWREWRTGLQYTNGDGSVFFGAIDDLLVKGDRYIPFDYKTKGSPTTAEDAAKYYQNQLDGYALLLEENGMPVAGFAFLLYFSPRSVGERGACAFHVQAIRLDADPARARETFRRAVALLRQAAPPAGAGCEYCAYLKRGASAGL
jgi:hypothetical protein